MPLTHGLCKFPLVLIVFCGVSALEFLAGQIDYHDIGAKDFHASFPSKRSITIDHGDTIRASNDEISFDGLVRKSRLQIPACKIAR